MVSLLTWRFCRLDGNEGAASAVVAPPSETDMRLCEKIMHMSFPPTTIPRAFFYRVGLDDSAYLKIEIPYASIDKLIENSPFRGQALSTTEKMVHEADFISWWAVRGVSRFESGRVEFPGIKFLTILIDRDDSSICRIYLKWWET